MDSTFSSSGEDRKAEKPLTEGRKIAVANVSAAARSSGIPGFPRSLTRSLLLLQGIDGQAAEKLGIKVSRFLRQDFIAEGDVSYLLHAGGVHEKCDIGCTAANL